jgi:hypothetical protein
MKKVLFIESRIGGDFTMDAVFAGLVNKYGAENVIDWPPKEKHREGIPQVTGDIEKDYGAERRSLCYTPEYQKAKLFHPDDINALFHRGEIERIFVDERMETFALYCQTMARYFPIPVVVIAGHDRFWNESPAKLREMYGKHLDMMFLDNWRPEYNDIPNARPMSYATNFDHLWDVSQREEFLKNKVYDVCFMGYNSHGDRARFVDHLTKRYGGKHNYLFVEKRPNTMEAFIRKSEYFKIMAQSRVCVNLVGGAECGKALRFYEIPYVGSAMLSQVDHAKQVNPFEHQKHCVYFSNEAELDNWVDILLGSDSYRETLAKAGHEHAMKYHTARARVDYIFQCLEQRS